MMTELAIQRTNDRMKDMFGHFVNEIRKIGEGKVDRDWFRSEEFQTLLYEALRQLHVTHDREKIEMLGVALANSGAPGFREDERKDLFIRFVRDLTRQHLKMLLSLVPPPLQFYEPPPPLPGNNWMRRPIITPEDNDKTIRYLRWNRRPSVTPQDDDLLALQMLHAYGLVEESLASPIQEPRIPSRPSESDLRGAVRDFAKQFEKPTIRSFKLSQLGQDFLDFMGLPKSPTKTA